MKLKDKCIVTTLGEESLLVMIGDEASTHRVIRLNDTAVFLVNRLKKDCTAQQLTEALLEEYDVSRETAEKSVQSFLDQLKNADLLED